jgi:aminodeoxyfutalosine synthase
VAGKSGTIRLEELVCGEMSDLLAKVQSGERLGRRDFLRLWNTRDLTGLGAVANFARERTSGDRTIYRYQAHLNYTGRPIAFCPECDARRQAGEPTPGIEYVSRANVGNRAVPVGEIHITGGTGSGHGVEDLRALVRRMRGANPQLHLRAFSWSELNAAADRDKREPAGVLAALVKDGIDSLAGGQLADLTPEDPHGGTTGIQRMEQYIPWVRAAAELGLGCEFAWVTTDGDEPEALADLLLCVRELQDRWAVIETCTPLQSRSRLAGVETPMPTGYAQLRTIAMARLVMDNIPRIESPIAVVGESVALAAQWYGADDVGGIPFQHRCAEGTTRAPAASRGDEIEHIRSAGRDPVDLYAGAR